MSPVVLHEDACTHLPPWQFVEQHSVPAAQALPRVVQATLFVGTGRSAHLPSAPQLPVQHCAEALQLWPIEAHAPPLEQVPPTQLRLQHSELFAQLSLAALQNVDEVHLCVRVVSHVVEQHSLPDAQFSPPFLQTGVGGASHAPLVHFPEQQSLGAEHCAAAARHWFTGSTQMWFAQEFVQQSALDPQTSPTALHCVALTQVPVHAVEQQSEGSAQLASSALHDPPSLDPPDFDPLPQAVTSARAVARKKMRRMATSRRGSSGGRAGGRYVTPNSL